MFSNSRNSNLDSSRLDFPTQTKDSNQIREAFNHNLSNQMHNLMVDLEV